MTIRMVFALVMLLAGTWGAAADEDTRRIRGTITQVEGPALTIATREGATVRVTLKPGARVAAVVPADLAAARPGSFIGTAAVPQADGTLRAQEVLIFPEAMRGVGEGHRPWDLTPDSTMTNATVEATVAAASGPELTLTYQGGQQRLVVPPGTPVVTLEPGNEQLLQPGSHVFLGASPNQDGSFSATRIMVGKDGLVPPM